MNNKSNNILNQKWCQYSIATCSAVLLFFILSNISILYVSVKIIMRALVPIIYGIVFAYLINPFVVFFEICLEKIKKGNIRRILAIIITVIVLFSIFFLLGLALIPQLIESIISLFNNSAQYISIIQTKIDWFAKQLISINIILPESFFYINEYITNFITNIELAPKLIETSVQIGNVFIDLSVGFFIGIYIIIEKNILLKAIKKLLHKLTKTKYTDILLFCKGCHQIMLRYIVCSILDGIIITFANVVFMIIAGYPYVALISVIVGVTNLIPTFGPIIGGIIGVFILVAENPLYAIIFLIFTCILQTIDGYYIKPRFFGNAFGISSLWVLISIIIGARLFGIIGILFAIPFAAIINYCLKK